MVDFPLVADFDWVDYWVCKLEEYVVVVVVNAQSSLAVRLTVG